MSADAHDPLPGHHVPALRAGWLATHRTAGRRLLHRMRLAQWPGLPGRKYRHRQSCLATDDPRIPWPRLAEPHRGRSSFDCPRATECTWQHQQPGGFCPPRRALAHGLDPRRCA